MRYFLTASEREPSGPPEDAEGEGWWMPPDNHRDRIERSDMGVVGPGPDFVLIPGSATVGEYRICTAKTDPNFWAELTIMLGPDRG